MDISSLSTKTANEEGVGVVITDPLTGDDLTNDANLPMTIYVVGRDSREYKAFQAEVGSRYRGDKTPSFSAAKKLALELVVRCTKAFENLQLAGSVVEFSPENAKRLYQNYPIIRDQIDEFINERSNFLGKSEKT